jgi:signal transduction histidine kinase
LGLPLCREIAQSHGGRIWAEQGSPSGTRMILEVPFEGSAVDDDAVDAAA